MMSKQGLPCRVFTVIRPVVLGEEMLAAPRDLQGQVITHLLGVLVSRPVWSDVETA
jgi:hypothetical protein